MAAQLVADPRTGRNRRHRLAGFLRRSIFSRLGGCEDINDADRLCRGPVIAPACRWSGGQARRGLGKRHGPVRAADAGADRDPSRPARPAGSTPCTIGERRKASPSIWTVPRTRRMAIGRVRCGTGASGRSACIRSSGSAIRNVVPCVPATSTAPDGREYVLKACAGAILDRGAAFGRATAISR